MSSCSPPRQPQRRRRVASHSQHRRPLLLYSPDLNPTEVAFAKLKILLRKTRERSIAATWHRISTLLEQFSLNKCANKLHHARPGHIWSGYARRQKPTVRPKPWSALACQSGQHLDRHGPDARSVQPAGKPGSRSRHLLKRLHGRAGEHRPPRLFKDVAVHAGGPDHCVQGSMVTALTTCGLDVPPVNVAALVSVTRSWAQDSLMDSVDDLQNQTSYPWPGVLDTTGRQPLMDALPAQQLLELGKPLRVQVGRAARQQDQPGVGNHDGASRQRR